MSKKIIIAKNGTNALTATDPRDFVFHTDYNTFQIINSGTRVVTLGTNASESWTTKAHGQGYAPFTIAFCKFSGTSRVGLVGTRAHDHDFWFTNFRVNTTNVEFGYLNLSGSNKIPTFAYIQTEVPMAGTPSVSLPTNKVIRVAKSGFNALTETNPNNVQFDSRYPSLKYAVTGSKTINVPSGFVTAGTPLVYEEDVVTHSLGYYPFFTASLVFSTASTINYIMPVTFADAGFENYDFIYTSTSKLIFRSERVSPFDDTLGGYTITIYYKVFSRDLAL